MRHVAVTVVGAVLLLWYGWYGIRVSAGPGGVRAPDLGGLYGKPVPLES